MAGISIKLSSFDEFMAVNVEGLGVIKIKKESSNHGLRRSEIMRDMFALQDEMKKLDKRMKKLLAEGKTEDDPEIEKLESRATEKLNSITELQRSTQQMNRARLSDDEGGALVEKLYEHASDADISKLFALSDGPGEEDETSS